MILKMWSRVNRILQISLIVLVTIYDETVISIKLGGPSNPTDFPYAIFVQKKNSTYDKLACVGLIDNEGTAITASKCINRTEETSYDMDYVPPGSPKRLKGWYAVSYADPKLMLEIEFLYPGKEEDGPMLGSSELAILGTAILSLKGFFKIKAKDDRGLVEGAGPAYTPWPSEPEMLKQMKMDGVEGYILGSDKKGAALKLLQEKDCMGRLSKMPDMEAVLLGWESSNATDIFCAMKANAAGKFPPGYPCDTDAGAPLVIKGAVWGILMGAWCNSDEDHLAVFRSDSRSWNIRRFDGSLTDAPDVRDLTEPPKFNPDVLTGTFKIDSKTGKVIVGPGVPGGSNDAKDRITPPHFAMTIMVMGFVAGIFTNQ